MLVQNNTPKINFNGRLPNKVYKNIKDIPNLRCVCCDEFMLTGAEKTEFAKKFKLPLKDILKLPVLERFKDTEVFEFLEKLAKKYPKKGFEESLELIEDKSLYKDLNIFTKLLVEDVAEQVEPLHVNSARFIELMDKYSDRFKGSTKELYEQLRFYSMKYPDKTFSEILEKSEVREFHRNSFNHKNEQAFTITHNVMKNIRKLAEKLDKSDRGLFNKALKDIEKYDAQVFRDHLIKKQYYIYKMTGRLRNLTNNNIKKKILKELEKLPEFSTNVDKYLSKKHSDESILDALLHSIEISFDHIQPHSKMGPDKIGNGLFMCSDCNNRRSVLPYSFMFSINSQFKANIKKQVNRIKSFIQGDRLKGNDFYPVDVKKVLSGNFTENIGIDLKGFLKYLDKKTEKRLKDCQVKVNANKAKLDEIDEEFETALKTIHKLKEKRKSLANEKSDLENELLLCKYKAKRVQDLIKKEGE